uniref:Endo/exonuclease/phosphatase domain-containing protein n=1 Tax=Schistosoma curassoni TaxID=6186 RepID=A0A183KJT2_9TREM
MNVISCYTTITDNKENDTHHFYKILQLIVEKCPGKKLKIRTDNTGYENIIKRHRLWKKYESEESFANLYAFMNVNQCYAPTNDYNEDVEDQFYSRLQSIDKKCPAKNLTILMGDLNVMVGMDNTGYEDIMGRHGLRERNENGERFANLSAFNKMIIGRTMFPHKRVHKTTWISPDHITENQIDQICINKKFRRTMEDVRTRRRADKASDHHLVVANLKLKLKKNWTTGQLDKQHYKGSILSSFEILTNSTNSR